MVLTVFLTQSAMASNSCRIFFTEGEFELIDNTIRIGLENEKISYETALSNGRYTEIYDMIEKFHRETERQYKKHFRSEEVFIEETGQKVVFHKMDAKLSNGDFRKLVRRMKKVLVVVDRVIPPEWIPPFIEVGAIKHFDNAYHMSDRMHVPFQMKFDKFSKHPNKSRPVLAHENGHDIFTEILGQNGRVFELFNIYAKVMERQQVLQNQMEAYSNFLMHIGESFMKENLTFKETILAEYLQQRYEIREREFEAEAKKIEQEGERLFQEYKEEIEQLSFDVFDIRDVTGGAHEFIADVIAVLSVREKNGDYKADAIYQALMHKGLYDKYEVKEINKNNRFRDFARKVKLEGWRTDSVHIQFNPTRYHVWENYISRSRYRQHPMYLFRNIANATIKEVLDRMKKIEDQGGDIHINAEELNRRLIDFIDKEFEANPLQP